MWLEEINRHLDLSPELKWRIRYAYSDSKMNKLASALTKDDWDFITPQPLNSHQPDGEKGPALGQSSLICVTTSGSYHGHVTTKMGEWFQPPRSGIRTRVPRLQFNKWELCWGRVAVDEAHLEVNVGSRSIRQVMQLGTGPTPHKWFLTGTPFERSPGDMRNWVATLQDPSWTAHTQNTTWPEKAQHRRKLSMCTAEALNQIGKDHVRLVEGGEKQGVHMLSQSTHVAKLQQILSTLWLKRSADTSTFFGKPLTEPIPNRHHIVECPLPAKYVEMVNKSAENVSAEL